MFDQHKELIPEEDAITVANSFVDSFPNVFVRVDQSGHAELLTRCWHLKLRVTTHNYWIALVCDQQVPIFGPLSIEFTEPQNRITQSKPAF